MTQDRDRWRALVSEVINLWAVSASCSKYDSRAVLSSNVRPMLCIFHEIVLHTQVYFLQSAQFNGIRSLCN